MSRTVGWGVAAILAIALLVLVWLGWGWWQRTQVAPERPQVPAAGGPAVPDTPVTPAPPAIQFPIEQASPDPQADPAGEPELPELPALEESDQPLAQALAQRQDRAAWELMLVPDGLIRRIVATVDNLPREQVAAQVMPLKPVPGSLRVDTGGYNVRIAPENAARYQPYVQAVESLDVPALVAIYVRWYPRFQQAYEDLGYPKAYFNDRLVQVLDHLLATPTINEPLAVVQPRVLWQFADPDLESRSAGQKMLLRMGPENAGRVKARLLEIRRAVAGQRAALTQPAR